MSMRMQMRTGRERKRKASGTDRATNRQSDKQSERQSTVGGAGRAQAAARQLTLAPLGCGAESVPAKNLGLPLVAARTSAWRCFSRFNTCRAQSARRAPGRGGRGRGGGGGGGTASKVRRAATRHTARVRNPCRQTRGDGGSGPDHSETHIDRRTHTHTQGHADTDMTRTNEPVGNKSGG